MASNERPAWEETRRTIVDDTSELAAWLRAQFDADATQAPDVHLVAGGDLDHACDNYLACGYDSCTCRWPARIEADVAAKRAIVDEVMSWSHAGYRGACPQADPDLFPDIPCDCDLSDRRMRILGPLTSAYAGRPGYHEEWRPT